MQLTALGGGFAAREYSLAYLKHVKKKNAVCFVRFLDFEVSVVP